MKNKILIVVFLSVFSFSNCEKECKIDLTGSLKVVFSSDSNVDFSKVSCYIYLPEDTDMALKASFHPNSQGEVYVNNLNHGNYIFKYYYESFGTQYFQISAGKETLLEFMLPYK